MNKKSRMIPFMVLLLSACNSSSPGVSGAGPSEKSAGVAPSAPMIPSDPGVPANPSTPSTGTGGSTRPIALVYDGTGACEEDCAKGAADAATAAGLTAKIVGPTALSNSATKEQVDTFFKNVAVWVQPGGYARQAYDAMTDKLRNSLKDFVKNGGGYVGFCAGAFMTTSTIGTTGATGLGIFPGRTAVFGGNPNSLGYSIERVRWNGSVRSIYYEGGPYLYNLDSSVDVVATYSDGSIAAARAPYGQGRVFISGPHPEAPSWWGGSDDPDGSDQDLAADMIRWAGHLE